MLHLSATKSPKTLKTSISTTVNSCHVLYFICFLGPLYSHPLRTSYKYVHLHPACGAIIETRILLSLSPGRKSRGGPEIISLPYAHVKLTAQDGGCQSLRKMMSGYLGTLTGRYKMLKALQVKYGYINPGLWLLIVIQKSLLLREQPHLDSPHSR